MTEQQEDSKPEIVDQSPKYVFETAPTGPEGNLSSAGQMLIGGLVGFSPLLLMFVIQRGARISIQPSLFVEAQFLF